MQLKKTLLALSILAASQAVSAYEVTLVDQPFNEAVDADYLSVFGSFTGEPVGIAAPWMNLTSDFQNFAQLDIEQTSNQSMMASGMEIGGLMPSSIGGSFFNRAAIDVLGYNANGIHLMDVSIANDLVNNAAINVTGFAGSASNGLLLDHTRLDNALVNNSDIISFGQKTKGVNLQRSYVENLLNGGSILSAGQGANAVYLSASTYVGTIQNFGTIGATIPDNNLLQGFEDGARAVVLGSGSLISVLHNQPGAVITATGAHGAGILVDGGEVTGGIRNDGDIWGDEYGIFVSQHGDGSKQLFITLVAGQIGGNHAAINGGHNTVLDWYGATILGDLHNMNTVVVRGGEAIFRGEDIYANNVVVLPSASLNLTQPHNFFWGDFDLLGNAELVMNLSPATDLNKAILNVSGIATLEQGSRIVLRSQLSDFEMAGKAYRLIQAGTLRDFGATVVSSSALMQASLVSAHNYDYTFSPLAPTPTPIPTPEPTPIPTPEPTPTPTPTPTDPTEPTVPTVPEIIVEVPTLPTVPPTQPAPGEPVVVVTPNTEAQNRELIARAGGNQNAQVAGARFATLLGGGNLSEKDPVVSSLLGAGQDTAAIARMAAQLAPETNGATPNAVMSGQGLVTGAIGGRVSGARSGMSSGEGFDELGGWIQLLNGDSKQDMRDGLDGYSTDSKGILFGADGKLSNKVTVGMSYSFVNTDVAADNYHKIEVDTHALSAYSSWNDDGYFVDGSATYGLSHNKSERQLPGTTAKANFDSDLFAINVMGGYAHELDSGLIVEPRIAGRYNQVNTEGYRERSESGAALMVENQRMEVLDLGAGMRLAGRFDLSGGLLVPEVKAMAYHDVIGDQADSKATFIAGGSQFTSIGASAARETYEFGLGASYRRDQVTMAVGYDRMMKTGFEADSFTAKVRYDF
ncbi:autotransporter outer membrane beta-barrel domain-containing protein [Pseudomonas sp. 9Ag]|uniref:autotransporter family protein n=1 Tax=Pseudomonas sp. 9Ag TaxID=2653167 RepID=UPI0012F3D22D|nr:autotransporter outer membrane beta-barrel domain-containing protein [Pseudomonas sp. 9Ag]VXC51347.1 Outer membrane autotransporter barrel domain-containing protein [Pseudomonas sp. 9Ag]